MLTLFYTLNISMLNHSSFAPYNQTHVGPLSLSLAVISEFYLTTLGVLDHGDLDIQISTFAGLANQLRVIPC